MGKSFSKFSLKIFTVCHSIKNRSNALLCFLKVIEWVFIFLINSHSAVSSNDSDTYSIFGYALLTIISVCKINIRIPLVPIALYFHNFWSYISTVCLFCELNYVYYFISSLSTPRLIVIVAFVLVFFIFNLIHFFSLCSLTLNSRSF